MLQKGLAQNLLLLLGNVLLLLLGPIYGDLLPLVGEALQDVGLRHELWEELVALLVLEALVLLHGIDHVAVLAREEFGAFEEVGVL